MSFSTGTAGLVLAAGAIALGAAGCQTRPVPAADAPLESGDIVFQDSVDPSGQAHAIKVMSDSRWSHCGIYFERPGRAPIVIDGDGAGPPQSWDAWRDAGVGGRYAAYRVRDGLSGGEAAALMGRAGELDGRAYDFKFAWGDAEIYCSELVWKAYDRALGIRLGEVQRFTDFDLDHPMARLLIERPGSWGTVENARGHGDEPVVSPQAITESERLVRVR